MNPDTQYIYLIENKINNKRYVGRTKNPHTRWLAHKKSKNRQAIALAIQKYGASNFSFSVIHTSDSFEDILQKETELIKQYNSHINDGYGYNQTYSSLGVSPESIPWNKGKRNIYSTDTINRMSAAHKGIPTWNKGKKTKSPSEETRRKIGEAIRISRKNKFWSTKKKVNNGDSLT